VVAAPHWVHRVERYFHDKSIPDFKLRVMVDLQDEGLEDQGREDRVRAYSLTFP